MIMVYLLSIHLFINVPMASEYQQIEQRIADAMDYRSYTQIPTTITELATMFNVLYQRLQRRL